MLFKRRIKIFYFIIEGLSSLACGYYNSYIFFLLRDQYGFGNLGNLSVAALAGAVFALSSWRSGKFAQRYGYFTALSVGFSGVVVSLLIGLFSASLASQLFVMMAWIASACFIWPSLEALVSESETGPDLTRMLGIYNVTWATTSALSYFWGGALFEYAGRRSIFWIPAGMSFVLLGIVRWMACLNKDTPHSVRLVKEPSHAPKTGACRQVIRPRTFLHMAWLANPFACIGINTVLAMAPTVTRNLHLSTSQSGIFCSIWFFSRLAAFVMLWRWKNWHYKYSWLLGAFLGLLAGFVMFLLAQNLWLLVFAQVFFGLSVGLIYYSSLFYSMDVGHTKGEHGGFHEAAMGVGNCVGPAVGAAALLLAPAIANAGTYAVSALLVAGLAGLVGMRASEIRFWWRKRP
jgi:MFS family permease